MAAGELTKRVMVAAVGIPAAVAVIYWGRWTLGATMGLLAMGGAVEYYRLAEARGVRPFVWPGAALAGALVLVAAVRPAPAAAAGTLWLLTVLSVLGLLAAATWRRGVAGGPLGAVAVTIMGAVFPGATLGYAVFLRHVPLPDAVPGRWVIWASTSLVAYPLAVTWINDSAAYFVGRRWGRRKLASRVSPGKTVEGAVAGLIGGVLAGWIWARFVWGAWLGVPIGVSAGAVGGLLLGAVAQVGDLAESVLKREAGVKDSGGLFPGHGGVLDRFDALFFSVPVAYWWVAWLLSR